MKKAIIAILVLTVGIGVFLRFYGNEWIYTEYDDVGVVSLYRAHVGNDFTRTIYTSNIVDISANVKINNISKNMLDTPFFPLYMGVGWTYPPGQYLIHPFLISEKDDFKTKLLVSRFISGVLGSILIFVFILILYELNQRRLDANMLLPTILVAMSANAILYSNHSSPYANNITTLAISMLLFIYYLQDRLKATSFMLLLYVLNVFNYLIIIAIPVYLVLAFILKNNKDLKLTIKEFWKGILLYVILFLPIYVLFMKTNAGVRGIMPPDAFGLEFVKHIVVQFFITLKANIAGIFVSDYLNIPIAVAIFGLLIYLIFSSKIKELDKISKAVLYFSIFYILLWIVLHMFRKLPMDQTRHLTIWLPIIALWLFFVLKVFEINQKLLVSISLVSILLGTYTNLKILEEKRDIFDYELIARQNVDTILFIEALQMLIAFPDKTVYYIDTNSFNKNLKNIVFPNKMLFVSQTMDLETYKKSQLFTKEKEEIFNQYTVEPIAGKFLHRCFTYNNYCGNSISEKNGFYLYELTRKDN